MIRNNYGTSEKLEFREIILQHVKKILDISSRELRASERILILNDSKQIIEAEDTRLSFCQSVEMLAYSLLPYFDKDMTKFYKENIIYLKGFHFEIEEKLPEGKFKEKLLKTEDSERTNIIISWEVRIAKEMFIELMGLLKRVDYLKSAVFGETDDDVFDEDSQEEGLD